MEDPRFLEEYRGNLIEKCFSYHQLIYLPFCVFVFCFYLIVNVPVYLLVHHPGCLSIYLSMCLSVYLSMCLPDCLSVCLSVCLPVYLSACLSLCLPVCESEYYCIYNEVEPAEKISN